MSWRPQWLFPNEEQKRRAETKRDLDNQRKTVATDSAARGVVRQQAWLKDAAGDDYKKFADSARKEVHEPKSLTEKALTGFAGMALEPRARLLEHQAKRKFAGQDPSLGATLKTKEAWLGEKDGPGGVLGGVLKGAEVPLRSGSEVNRRLMQGPIGLVGSLAADRLAEASGLTEMGRDFAGAIKEQSEEYTGQRERSKPVLHTGDLLRMGDRAREAGVPTEGVPNPSKTALGEAVPLVRQAADAMQYKDDDSLMAKNLKTYMLPSAMGMSVLAAANQRAAVALAGDVFLDWSNWIGGGVKSITSTGARSLGMKMFLEGLEATAKEGAEVAAKEGAGALTGWAAKAAARGVKAAAKKPAAHLPRAWDEVPGADHIARYAAENGGTASLADLRVKGVPREIIEAELKYNPDLADQLVPLLDRWKEGRRLDPEKGVGRVVLDRMDARLIQTLEGIIGKNIRGAGGGLWVEMPIFGARFKQIMKGRSDETLRALETGDLVGAGERAAQQQGRRETINTLLDRPMPGPKSRSLRDALGTLSTSAQRYRISPIEDATIRELERARRAGGRAAHEAYAHSGTAIAVENKADQQIREAAMRIQTRDIGQEEKEILARSFFDVERTVVEDVTKEVPIRKYPTLGSDSGRGPYAERVRARAIETAKRQADELDGAAAKMERKVVPGARRARAKQLEEQFFADGTPLGTALWIIRRKGGLAQVPVDHAGRNVEEANRFFDMLGRGQYGTAANRLGIRPHATNGATKDDIFEALAERGLISRDTHEYEIYDLLADQLDAYSTAQASLKENDSVLEWLMTDADAFDWLVSAGNEAAQSGSKGATDELMAAVRAFEDLRASGLESPRVRARALREFAERVQSGQLDETIHKAAREMFAEYRDGALPPDLLLPTAIRHLEDTGQEVPQAWLKRLDEIQPKQANALEDVFAADDAARATREQAGSEGLLAPEMAPERAADEVFSKPAAAATEPLESQAQRYPGVEVNGQSAWVPILRDESKGKPREYGLWWNAERGDVGYQTRIYGADPEYKSLDELEEAYQRGAFPDEEYDALLEELEAALKNPGGVQYVSNGVPKDGRRYATLDDVIDAIHDGTLRNFEVGLAQKKRANEPIEGWMGFDAYNKRARAQGPSLIPDERIQDVLPPRVDRAKIDAAPDRPMPANAPAAGADAAPTRPLVHPEDVAPDGHPTLPSRIAGAFMEDDRIKRPLRTDYYDEFMQDVADSGVREPVLLFIDQDTGLASIVEGNHRAAAAIATGQDNVPVKVRFGHHSRHSGEKKYVELGEDFIDSLRKTGQGYIDEDYYNTGAGQRELLEQLGSRVQPTDYDPRASLDAAHEGFTDWAGQLRGRIDKGEDLADPLRHTEETLRKIAERREAGFPQAPAQVLPDEFDPTPGSARVADPRAAQFTDELLAGLKEGVDSGTYTAQDVYEVVKSTMGGGDTKEARKALSYVSRRLKAMGIDLPTADKPLQTTMRIQKQAQQKRTVTERLSELVPKRVMEDIRDPGATRAEAAEKLTDVAIEHSGRPELIEAHSRLRKELAKAQKAAAGVNPPEGIAARMQELKAELDRMRAPFRPTEDQIDRTTYSVLGWDAAPEAQRAAKLEAMKKKGHTDDYISAVMRGLTGEYERLLAEEQLRGLKTGALVDRATLFDQVPGEAAVVKDIYQPFVLADEHVTMHGSLWAGLRDTKHGKRAGNVLDRMPGNVRGRLDKAADDVRVYRGRAQVAESEAITSGSTDLVSDIRRKSRNHEEFNAATGGNAEQDAFMAYAQYIGDANDAIFNYDYTMQIVDNFGRRLKAGATTKLPDDWRAYAFDKGQLVELPYSPGGTINTPKDVPSVALPGTVGKMLTTRTSGIAVKAARTAAYKSMMQYTNLWKVWAAPLNPRFHIRNWISGKWNLYLKDGIEALNPAADREAFMVVMGGVQPDERMHTTNMTKLLGSGTVAFGQPVAPGMHKGGWWHYADGTPRVMVTNDGTVYTYEQVWERMMAEGLTEGGFFGEDLKRALRERMASDLAAEAAGGKTMLQTIATGDSAGRKALWEASKGTGRYNPLSLNFEGYELVRKIGSTVEAQQRAQGFMADLRKLNDPRAASMNVKRYLFDYGENTPAVGLWGKAAYPFLSWTKNNVPLQFAELFQQPGKFAAFGDVKRAVEGLSGEDAGDLTPSHLRDQAAIRMPMTDTSGTPLYWSHGLPMADLSFIPPEASWKGVQSVFDQVAGGITPGFTIPYEVATGRRIRTGAEIKNPTAHAITGFVPPAGTTARVALPEWSEEQGLGKANPAYTGGSWLMGTRLTPVDYEQQYLYQLYNYQDALRAALERAQREKDLGWRNTPLEEDPYR